MKKLTLPALAVVLLTILTSGCALPSIPFSLLPTPISPTSTPIPPTPTLPPDANIFKLKSEGDKLMPSSGNPYIISMFTREGKKASGISADFRNTKFDISSVNEEHKRDIGVAVQVSPDHKFEITIYVDGTNLEFFYINNDYMVYPQNVSTIKDNGPFVRFVFHRKGEDGKDELLGNWDISVEQAGRKVSEKLSAGIVDLANVTPDPIQFNLTDPTTSKTYESVAFPVIRGAIEGLVVYKVRDVTGP